MNRNIAFVLSLLAVAVPTNLSEAARVHLEHLERHQRRETRGRGPSDGKFQELLTEAKKMRLERPVKFETMGDRRAGFARDEWRWDRNKRKKAAQKLRA